MGVWCGVALAAGMLGAVAVEQPPSTRPLPQVDDVLPPPPEGENDRCGRGPSVAAGWRKGGLVAPLRLSVFKWEFGRAGEYGVARRAAMSARPGEIGEGLGARGSASEGVA